MKQYTLEELENALRENNGNKAQTAKQFHLPRMTFCDMLNRARQKGYAEYKKDPDILAQNVKLAREKQKAQDINRIERKAFREHSREYNALVELNKELIRAIKQNKHEYSSFTIPENKKAIGLIQLTDMHFNEQVDLPHNKYNWEIAGKRLRKHVLESIRFFYTYDVTNVVVAISGDSINSSRRPDELLTNAKPIANGVVMAYDYLRQTIDELHKEFNISVLSAWGNESRLDKDIGYVDNIASNNFDSSIYKHLAMEFEDVSNVSFIGEGLEVLINVCGLNVLILHGHTYENDLEKATVKIKAKYASKGVIIDYVISGHIHSPFISGYFARGGSMTGDNTYNFNALHIAGRASQNSFVFQEDGTRLGLMVDLQNVDNIDGYKFCKSLESYYSKSESKCEKEETIIKIVV